MPGTAVATTSSAPVYTSRFEIRFSPLFCEPVEERRVRSQRPGPDAVGARSLSS